MKRVSKIINDYIVGKGIIRCETKKAIYYLDIESHIIYTELELLNKIYAERGENIGII